MNVKLLNRIGLISLLGFLLLNAVLSALSSNLSFTLFAFGYVLIVVMAGLFIEKKNRAGFKSITYLFFLVYSLFAVVSYFSLYENPLVNHLGDVDQIGYYERALYLSSLTFSNIWSTAFTEFQFSEAPLFNAWIATLHKISGLDAYFGALFQKLNVVFFSGFIPSILYLMIEKVTGEKRVAIKWSIIFGLFSFIFYYSGILLRDIHLTLIYTWAFYLILKEEYSLKLYLLLIILGISSYYLRVESGLFFLGFFGIWLLYSNSKRKWIIGLLSVPAIAAVIFYIGGIDSLLTRGINTIQAYGARGVQAASDDSLGAALSQLPIPLNWISKFSFSQVSPFPFWAIFEDNLVKNIFHVPRVLGTLFWIFIWIHILVNFQKAKPAIKKYQWPLLLAVTYIFLVSQGQPYERRLFQVYPFLFVLFVSISQIKLKRSEMYFGILYAGLVGFYLILKYL